MVCIDHHEKTHQLGRLFLESFSKHQTYANPRIVSGGYGNILNPLQGGFSISRLNGLELYN